MDNKPELGVRLLPVGLRGPLAIASKYHPNEPALARVCKKFHREVLAVYYAKNTFTFPPFDSAQWSDRADHLTSELEAVEEWERAIGEWAGYVNRVSVMLYGEKESDSRSAAAKPFFIKGTQMLSDREGKVAMYGSWHAGMLSRSGERIFGHELLEGEKRSIKDGIFQSYVEMMAALDDL